MLTKKDRAAQYKVIEGVFKIRVDNVRKLLGIYETWAELARRTGQSSSFLIAIAGPNPRRSIGEKLARDLEHALKLQTGYLDTAH